MIRNSQHLNNFDLENSLFTKSKKIKIIILKQLVPFILIDKFISSYANHNQLNEYVGSIQIQFTRFVIHV